MLIKQENQDFKKKGKERFLQRGLWYNGKNRKDLCQTPEYLRITSVKGDRALKFSSVSFHIMKQRLQ